MLLAVTCSTLVLACNSSSSPSTPDVGAAAIHPGASADHPCSSDGDVLDTAKVYIEHNATDADTGVHGLIGGAPWQSICVTASDGTVLWAIEPSDRLGELGVSDFFWESNEPPNGEYSIDDLESDFPAGVYLVSSIGVDGVGRVAEALFTHTIPAEPLISEPPLVPDLDGEEPPVIDGPGLVVVWEPVTETIDGQPIDIAGYQVIITDEEADDPNGWARPVYDVHVGPTVTALPVPDEFFEFNTIYEVEVLAIEPSGNQTISVGFFRTGGR